MGTTGAWKISLELTLDAAVSEPVPSSAWSVEEISPSIGAVESAVEATGPDHLQRAVVAIFGGDFAYVVLSGLSGRMRFVIGQELAAGTVEGLEAIDAVERLPGDASFSWQGSTGMLDADGVLAVVSGVMTTDRGRMSLEGRIAVDPRRSWDPGRRSLARRRTRDGDRVRTSAEGPLLAQARRQPGSRRPDRRGDR
jgi:hypothetical protein